MEEKILKSIVENKAKFIPHLFTVRQVELIEKYLYNIIEHKEDAMKAEMSKSEKAYLYSTIKKKVDALMLLKEEVHIKGSNMIPERVEKAREILKTINKEKAFISGTFLFAQDYNDIDIYVISNKRKQFHQKEENSEKELHFIYITEDDLKKPIFNSASQYCVANFFVETPTPLIKRPNYDELIMTYEGAIIEIMDNDDQKTFRQLIFEYYLQLKGIIFDSYAINKLFKEILLKTQEERIKLANNFAKELLLQLFSCSYLYNNLSPFIKRIESYIPEYKANENLKVYVEVFTGVKNECRGN